MSTITDSIVANAGETVRRMNPHIFGAQKSAASCPVREMVPGESSDVANQNKTERLWWDHLVAGAKLGLWSWLGCKCITLKLADDTRYTPDAWALTPGGVLQAFEVKGFWRDDAKVKVKVAARQFPWIRFVVVTRKDGMWNQEAVQP